jgi:nucleoside-diphosphate-sugar epimerase
MKILLTGGSGFIGSHFHKKIDNSEIINYDLRPPNFEATSTYIKGDIRIKSDLINCLQNHQLDCVVSLAAKHHDFGIGHDEYFDTNEEGTRALCEAASEFNIKKIVFYSSVAVYGIRDQVSSENMEPLPDSPYGASKLAGEKVLQNWAEEDATRTVVIIRPTLTFGQGNVGNMYNLIKQIDSGLYFHLGKADNIKSIAYVENLVKATLFLMDRMKPGVAVYNYADEPQLTTRAISETIASFLKSKIHFTIPRGLGILAGFPFDILIKVTGKNFPISSARIKKLGTQTYHSAEKIFNYGFVPTYTTKEGLEKMVAWYKQNRK